MTDYFPRDTKRQGAWMDAFDPGEVTPDGKETRPIIYNVAICRALRLTLRP